MTSTTALLLAGFVLLALAAAPLAGSCVRIARRCVDDGRPFLRVCIALFVFCLSVVLVSTVLGVIGLYSRVPFVVAFWICSALLWFASDRIPTLAAVPWRGPSDAEAAATALEQSPNAVDENASGGRDWIRLLTWALVAGIATTAFVAAIVAPSQGADALNYHLPDIANWVRDHHFWEVRQLQLGVYQNAYPMNAETIAAFFVVPFGRDWLVNVGTVVQFAFVVAAVGALVEHVAGSRPRSRSAMLLCGLAVATMPIVATSHLGSVGSDLLPIAGIVVFLLFADRWRRTEAPVDLLVAVLALGMAFGAKFTTIVYVPLLLASFVVLVMWRRKWAQALLLVPLAFALPAVFWYVRNVVAHGNPLWPFDVLGLPTAFLRDNADKDSIFKWFATDGPAAVVKAFVFYVLAAFGVTGLLAAGIPNLWRALKGDRTRLWFFLAVPVVAIPVLWTQDWTAGAGGFNAPATARYVASTFAVLLAVTIGEALEGKRARVWSWALVVVVAANAAVAFLAPTVPSMRVANSALLAGVLAGIVALVWGWTRPRVSARILLAGVGVVLVAVVAVAAVRWDSSWYRQSPDADRSGLYRAVQDMPVQNARIAVGGVFRAYPLYGKDFSNEVVYIGDGPRVEAWTPGDRDRWLAELRAQCVDYVAVEDDETHWLHEIAELEFVSNAPGLEPVFAAGGVGLYRFDNGCQA